MHRIRHHRAAQAFLPRPLQHWLAKIGPCYFRRRRGALDGQREIAAAGGEVQKRGGIPPGDDVSRTGPPKEIEPAGEEMIGEVVLSRYGREKGVDELWLLQEKKPTCAAR